MSDIKEIDTDNHKEHGANRCPQCHASDITYNIKKGKLVCNYCHTEFDGKEVADLKKDPKTLKGDVRTTGIHDVKDDHSIITLKCSGCGAEVSINANETTNVRCHWCRSILSINSQIDNGAIPDLILPFKLEKKEAEDQIEKFIEKRKFFADKQFKKEFSLNNIMGVYFPYILVDANCHAEFKGEGGIVTGSHEEVVGKDKDGKEETETVYEIDVYQVERKFDVAINDLSIEASKDKINKKNKEKTTNVINAIMPFDTENCVQFESNYLVGYTSEKRDINVDNIEHKVQQSIADVARHSINPDLEKYDSGVSWDHENVQLLGTQWVTAYLPVWLYSYQEVKGDKKVLHYVAVNARTGETMGSIPQNKTKLFLFSFFISLLVFLIPISFSFVRMGADIHSLVRFPFTYFFLIIAIIVYFCTYASKKEKYRNQSKRHKYETETEHVVSNIVRKDKYVTNEESRSRYLYGNTDKIVGEYIDIEEKSNEQEEEEKK